MDRDETAEPLREGALHEDLRRAGKLRRIRLEQQLRDATAEVRAHDALARRREEHDLDKRANVSLIGALGGAPTMIELEGKGEVHRILRSRSLVVEPPPP